MKTKRGPLPTWAWILVAAGGLLALRWWRGRSPGTGAATVTAPSTGLQPLVAAGSPSMVSTPAGTGGVGSSTYGATTIQHASSYVPKPITIGGQEYMGQLTEGGKGETEYFSESSQIAALGGGSWKGPGHYTRLKMPPTEPGGGQNTIWIYAGA